jgi:hypothetical protein
MNKDAKCGNSINSETFNTSNKEINDSMSNQDCPVPNIYVNVNKNDNSKNTINNNNNNNNNNYKESKNENKKSINEEIINSPSIDNVDTIKPKDSKVDVNNILMNAMINKDNNRSLFSIKQSIMKNVNDIAYGPNKDNNMSVNSIFQSKNEENDRPNFQNKNNQKVFYTPEGLMNKNNYVNEPIKVNYNFNNNQNNKFPNIINDNNNNNNKLFNNECNINNSNINKNNNNKTNSQMNKQMNINNNSNNNDNNCNNNGN